jgi:hypothetical protein
LSVLLPSRAVVPLLPLSVDEVVVDPLQAAASRVIDRTTVAAIVLRLAFIATPLSVDA